MLTAKSKFVRGIVGKKKKKVFTAQNHGKKALTEVL